MNAFLLDSKESAQVCRQMIQLSGDCAALIWSRTIKNIPQNIQDSLEQIKNFSEEYLLTLCEGCAVQEKLDSKQESILHDLCRKSAKLGKILGSGVVLAGDEAAIVKRELSNTGELASIGKLLESGKNLVLL